MELISEHLSVFTGTIRWFCWFKWGDAFLGSWRKNLLIKIILYLLSFSTLSIIYEHHIRLLIIFKIWKEVQPVEGYLCQLRQYSVSRLVFQWTWISIEVLKLVFSYEPNENHDWYFSQRNIWKKKVFSSIIYSV